MTGKERRWQEVYASGETLKTKLRVHDKYSSVPINRTKEIVNLLPIQGTESLLDIGCGTGQFLQDLQEKGHTGSLIGVDISSGGFRQRNEATNILFIRGSGLNLPLTDSSFDFVTSLHALSHIQELHSLVNETKRVLKPNGLFLATANSLANYPHVREFRNRVFESRNWGQANFTTSRFNAENSSDILNSYWQRVDTTIVEGELKIPVNEFKKYFEANIPVWDHQPSQSEKKEILKDIDIWANNAAEDGYIIEPKWMSFTVCAD